MQRTACRLCLIDTEEKDYTRIYLTRNHELWCFEKLIEEIHSAIGLEVIFNA